MNPLRKNNSCPAGFRSIRVGVEGIEEKNQKPGFTLRQNRVILSNLWVQSHGECAVRR